MSMYQDPGMDPAERIKANQKHDQENHIVCMWQRAKYRGEFGYPPEPKKRPRLSAEEFRRRRQELSAQFGMLLAE